MGTVYLAEHTLIGRKAAVKVLLSELSRKPDIVKRFFNEARASTAIAHPGIVQAFDFGYHEGSGCAFIVMELLTGEALDVRLKRLRKLSEDDAMRITRQCASALAAAHDAGIVHRDLKPGNIYLTPDPEMEGGERARILDFGIAKLSGTFGGGSGEVQTRTGSMLGTPVYMSPEQCRGAGEVDHRSDIYALACVLFRMVCGQPPFVGEGVGEIIGAHLYQPPPSLLSIDPSLSPQLDAVGQRALAKSPDQRFASMTELAEALRSLRRAPSAHPYTATPPVGTPRPGQPMPTPPGWGSVSLPTPAGPGPAPAGVPQPGPPGNLAPGMPPNTLTTLGGSASQRMAGPQRPRRNRVLLAAGGAAAVAAGLVLVLTLGGSDGEPPTSQAGSPGVGEPQDPQALQAAGGETGQGTGESTDQSAARTPGEDPDEPTGAQADGAGGEGTVDDAIVMLPDEVDEKPEVAPITVTVESTPEGASVFLPDADEPLGKTPYTYTASPQPGEVTLELRLHGHRRDNVTFAGDQDDTVHVALERRRRERRRRSRKPSKSRIDNPALLER